MQARFLSGKMRGHAQYASFCAKTSMPGRGMRCWNMKERGGITDAQIVTKLTAIAMLLSITHGNMTFQQRNILVMFVARSSLARGL